ncbi:MAG: LysM peptidoglycan-binding domain-containing protein [Dehalococcoidia bacterium]
MRLSGWTRLARAGLVTMVAATLLLVACSDEDPSSTPTPEGATSGAIPTASPFSEQPPATIVAAAAQPLDSTATAEATSTAASGFTSYTVQPGDTLSAIGNEFGVDPDEIAAANGITDPTSLFVGQEILIPGVEAPAETPTAEPTEAPTETATAEPTETPTEAPADVIYVVQAGDSMISIAAQYGVSVDALAAANGLTEADFLGLQIGQELIIPQ